MGNCPSVMRLNIICTPYPILCSW